MHSRFIFCSPEGTHHLSHPLIGDCFLCCADTCSGVVAVSLFLLYSLNFWYDTQETLPRPASRKFSPVFASSSVFGFRLLLLLLGVSG
jgi:hypothetical protein